MHLLKKNTMTGIKYTKKSELTPLTSYITMELLKKKFRLRFLLSKIVQLIKNNTAKSTICLTSGSEALIERLSTKNLRLKFVHTNKIRGFSV